MSQPVLQSASQSNIRGQQNIKKISRFSDPEKKKLKKKYSPGDQEHVFQASFLRCIKEYDEVRENG